jgi:hypothetical protein
LTALALVVSSLVKLAKQSLSRVHLQIIICYLTLLGSSIIRAIGKWATITEHWKRRHIPVFAWISTSASLTLYAIVTNSEQTQQLLSCDPDHKIAYTSLITMTVCIDVLATLYWLWGACIVRLQRGSSTEWKTASMIIALAYWPFILGLTEGYYRLISVLITPEETEWTFGQVFSMTLLVVPVYELYVSARRKTPGDEHHRRWRLWWDKRVGGCTGIEP